MHFQVFTSKNMVSPHVQTFSTATILATPSLPLVPTTTPSALAELSISSQEVSFLYFLFALCVRFTVFPFFKACNLPNSQSRKNALLVDTSQQLSKGSDCLKQQRVRTLSQPYHPIYSLSFYQKLTPLQKSTIQDEYDLLIDHFGLPSSEALRDIKEAYESKSRFAEDGNVSGFLESFHNDNEEETDGDGLGTNTTTYNE